MTSRNFLAAQTRSELIERCELQTAVARDARNRRLAIQIAVNERLHDIALEFLFQIQNIKREAKLFRDSSRVVNVVERAATRRQRLAVFVDTDAAALVPQLHRKADQFVALLLQNGGSGGRIHAAGHGYSDLHSIIVSGFRFEVSS